MRWQRAPETVRMLTLLLVLHPGIGAVRLVDGDATVIFEFYLRKRLETFQFRELKKDLRQAYEAFDLFSHDSKRLVKVYRADKGFRQNSSRSSNSFEGDSAEGVPAVDNGSGSSAAEAKAEKSQEALEAEAGFVYDVDRAVLERVSECPMTFAEFWEGLTSAVECVVIERDLSSLTCSEIDMLVEVMREEFGPYLVEGVNSFLDDERLIMEAERFSHCLESLKTQRELNGCEALNTGNEVIAYRDDLRVIVFVANSDKTIAV